MGVGLSVIDRAAAWAGVLLDDNQRNKLAVFGAWLIGEASAAGGLGPGEMTIMESRHLADSLLFAHGWWSTNPESILDVGSGVGLPAVPLAIASPRTRVIALDRSSRRARLIRRAGRLLDLPNLAVLERDVAEMKRDRFPVVVSRAALPPARLRPHLQRLLLPGGIAVVGGSHVTKSVEEGYETLTVPAEVLDRPVWILIMAKP